MTETALSPPANPVDPDATWLRMVTKERRAFREFCAAASDDARADAHAAWLAAHRNMMDCPAPTQTALGQKVRSFVTLANMQSGTAAQDLSAIVGDLWRMADMDVRPTNAEAWIEAFRFVDGRWTIDGTGVEFLTPAWGLAADLLMANRLEAQVRADPDLEAAVLSLILSKTAEVN
jgi:hypothetical protein